MSDHSFVTQLFPKVTQVSVCRGSYSSFRGGPDILESGVSVGQSRGALCHFPLS